MGVTFHRLLECNTVGRYMMIEQKPINLGSGGASIRDQPLLFLLGGVAAAEIKRSDNLGHRPGNWFEVGQQC